MQLLVALVHDLCAELSKRPKLCLSLADFWSFSVHGGESLAGMRETRRGLKHCKRCLCTANSVSCQLLPPSAGRGMETEPPRLRRTRNGRWT